MPRVWSQFSKRSKYYISRHIFMTVYHYCLNYDEWVSEYNLNVGLRKGEGEGGGRSKGEQDPTSEQAIRLADLYQKIETIRSAAYAAEPELYDYLLAYVTQSDMTFDKLKARGMPCERKMFYDRRRKFYWIMSKKLHL